LWTYEYISNQYFNPIFINVIPGSDEYFRKMYKISFIWSYERGIYIYDFFTLNIVMTFIFVDLLLIIKSPFYPRERRKYQYWATYLLSLVLFKGVYELTRYYVSEEYPYVSDNTIETVCSFGISSLFGSLNIIVIIMIVKRICKNGTSSNLRKKIFFEYATLFIINILFSISNFMIIYTDDHRLNMWNHMYMATLQVNIIIRIREPFIWRNVFKYRICKLCVKDTYVAKDSLNSFVNSAINVEYVYLILVGVNNFMKI
jgi:hypothetical protein